MKATGIILKLLGGGGRGASRPPSVDIPGRQRRGEFCHLEIRPSPFKWEVSGRAQRTVGAGEPSRKSPGPAEGGREREKEREQGSALRLRHIYAPQQHSLAPAPAPATEPLQRCRRLCARTERPPLSRNTAQCRECGEELTPGRKRGSTEVLSLSWGW